MKQQTPPVVTRTNVLDRMIEPFAPRFVIKRLAARHALNEIKRAYEGAARDRQKDNWRTPNTSADAEIGPAAQVLRDRMRDLVRNNPIAAKAVSVWATNLIGSGIRPRANTGKKSTDKKVNAAFEKWSKECDADGHTDFYGLQMLAVREMIEGGDLFAIRRYRRKDDGLTVPLQIQLMEADHLDDAKNEDTNRSSTRYGIQYDAIGRRKGYWFFKDHPGERPSMSGRSFQSEFTPVERVVHMYERQRVQSRGVPWGTPVLSALRDIADWQGAEMVRKKIEASLTAFVVAGDDVDDTQIGTKVTDADGVTVEQFEPGLIAYLRGGKDVKFNTPSSASGMKEWHSVMMHIVAAGYRMPYELLTADLSEVNFASFRAGMNDFARLVDAFQWQLIIPALCEPFWKWFTEAAYLAGEIPSPDVPVKWSVPKRESVNPLQDAQADLVEVRAGFMSLSEAIARRGYDPEEVMAEAAANAKLLDELELVFDSDPRRVSKGGQAQTIDPMNPPGGDATPAEPAPAPAAAKEGKKP